MELAAQYEKLLAGGLVLNVEAQLINVDSNCPVVIDSLNEVECKATLMSETTVINLTLILSIVISVSIILILLVTTIIVITAVTHNRKKKSRNLNDVA